MRGAYYDVRSVAHIGSPEQIALTLYEEELDELLGLYDECVKMLKEAKKLQGSPKKREPGADEK